MPTAAINAYVRHLPRHLATYASMLAEAASFPHMDERARQAKADAWASAARGENAGSASAKRYALNMETQTFEEVTD